MVPGGRGVRREEERVGPVVAGNGEDRLDVERDRDEDHAVEGHPFDRLQPVHDAARARRPVAFAEEVFGRVPAAVVADVLLDEPRDRFDVRVDPPEILVLGVAEGPRVAGADGVDHDEVGLVDDAEGVVDELVGRRRRGRGVGRHDAAGAERPEMQPDGRRTGPAVVRERDRAPARAAGVAPDVGGVAHAGPRLVLVVAQDQGAHGGGVADRHAGDRHGALRR